MVRSSAISFASHLADHRLRAMGPLQSWRSTSPMNSVHASRGCIYRHLPSSAIGSNCPPGRGKGPILLLFISCHLFLILNSAASRPRRVSELHVNWHFVFAFRCCANRHELIHGSPFPTARNGTRTSFFCRWLKQTCFRCLHTSMYQVGGMPFLALFNMPRWSDRKLGGCAIRAALLHRRYPTSP